MTLRINEKAQVLNNTPLPSSLFSLFASRPDRALKKGEFLFQGAGNQVFLVIQGIVKQSVWMDDREVPDDYFVSGDLINCEALLPDSRKDRMAVALFQDTVVREVPVFSLAQAVRSDPGLQKIIWANILGSLNRSRQKVQGLSALTAEQRVLHFLLEYVERAGKRVGYEHFIRPVMTHREISQFAGVARQTVSTTLGKLKRVEIIHATRKYMIIRDIEALGRLIE